MKIALAQLNFHVGNFEGNLMKMKEAVDEAAAAAADLIVFPELAVPAYPPRDFLEFDDFIERCEQSIAGLARHSGDKGLAVIVGSPERNPVPEGKDLYNAAWFIEGGAVRQIVRKGLLPTYDVFDEYRYFEPSREFRIIRFKGRRIALTICEDLWNIGNENPLYTINPMEELMKQEPEIMINIAASPFAHGHTSERKNVLKDNVKAYGIPLIYVNHSGAQTELLFDGGSMLINDAGRIVEELPYFEECIRYFHWDDCFDAGHPLESDREQVWDKNAVVYKGLIEGIRNYFYKLGFREAILGLSGGIDSALTLVLAAEALGAENVHALLMPSMFSSEGSVSDARCLAEKLCCEHRVIPITDVYHSYLDVLNPHFEKRPFDITEENLQARIRANYLMALSNKFGYILLNTSNKSELAVGYGTLYGDMAGGLSVIGDLYKTEVYDMARWINREDEIIPQRIIEKLPSAELRPEQSDQDTLPPYDLLDQVLHAYIEEEKGPAEIVAMGFDRNLVARVLSMVNRNEYKRYQFAPVLRVSPKAFGMGRRMPIVAKYLS